MEGDKVPSQTLEDKEDICCLKVTRRKKSHHTKHLKKVWGILILLYLKNVDVERFVVIKMLHDHKLQVETVEGEKSTVPNHNQNICLL